MSVRNVLAWFLLAASSLSSSASSGGGLPDPIRIDSTNFETLGVRELFFDAWTNDRGAEKRLRKFAPDRSEAPVLARHFNYTLMAEFLEREIIDDDHVVLAFHAIADGPQIVIPPDAKVEIRLAGSTWIGEIFCIRYRQDAEYVLPSIEFANKDAGLTLAPARWTEGELLRGKGVPSGTLYGIGDVGGAVPFWVRMPAKADSGASWAYKKRVPFQCRIVSGKGGESL